MQRIVALGIVLGLAWVGPASAQHGGVVTAPSTASALVGGLAFDGTAQGALVGTAGGASYHTYVVDVPPGVERWTLTLDADADLDLAAKLGAEIHSYDDRDRGGDWDFRDIGTQNPTVLAIERPRAGRWYVDVFNALPAGTRGGYRLALTPVAGAAAAPPAPALPGKAGPTAPAAPAAVLTAPSADSTVVGALPLDGVGQGTLRATAGGNAFHTYWVEVPAGVERWTLTLDADADLDLAAKLGAEVQNYADREGGGDWDVRDLGTQNPAQIAIERPGAGRWYVDVFTLLPPGSLASYRLTSSASAGAAPVPTVPGPPAPGPTAPAPPAGPARVAPSRAGPTLPPALGGPAAPVGFTGRFQLRGGDATLTLDQDPAGQLRGTLAGGGARLTVEGVTGGDGTYGVIYDDQGGMFFAADLTGSGVDLVLYDADAEGKPIESSARRLEFDRVGDAPAVPEAPPGAFPLPVPPGGGALPVPPGGGALPVPPGGGALPVPPGGGALPVPPTGVASPETGTVDLRPGLEVRAGDRARVAQVGASVVVPHAWLGGVSDEPLLPLYLGSNTEPGLAVVLMTHGVTLEELGRVLSEPIELEDGAVLRPLAAPQAQGDQLSVRYAGAGGVGLGVARTSGGPGVILLYLGGAGHEAVGASLLGAVAASARFEEGALAAAVARVRQDWSGHQMWTYSYRSAGLQGGSISHERESSWDLCADGRYLHRGANESTGNAWAIGATTGTHERWFHDAGDWAGRGRWTLAAIGDQVVLVLFDDGGSWSYYRLTWTAGGQYRLDGNDIDRRATTGC